MPAKRTFPERMDLVDTKISRGGVTSNYWKTESCKVSCSVRHSKKVLSIQFDIASKGGGQPGIDVQIGIQDLANILRSVAEYMPEIGTTLSECAAIASTETLGRWQKPAPNLKNWVQRSCYPHDDEHPRNISPLHVHCRM